VPQEFSNKEQGDFYGPDHTLFTLMANDLEKGKEYELKVTIDKETPNEKILSSKTFLPADISPGFPMSSTIKKVSLVNSNSYEVYSVNWNSGEYGVRYDVKVRIKFDEYYSGGTSTKKEIYFNLGSVKSNGTGGGEALHLKFIGQQLYEYLGTNIPDPGTDVTKRVFKGLDFVFDVAGSELDTYMEVNSPVSQVFQERPEYSNIENGLGIFSGRMHKEVGTRWLSKLSFQELCLGNYTKHLKFCSDSLGYVLDTDPCFCDNL